jgi:hypothetical protein
MTENGSNKTLVWLVVLAVILSAVFTWKVLDKNVSSPVPEQTQNTVPTASESKPAVVMTIEGNVGVDIQPKQTKEGV